jgi:Putative phage tail protein
LYAVDLTEVDGKLCAVTRGCAEVVTVEEDDLAARDWSGQEESPPPRVATQAAHELELPAAVEVTYFEPARAYTNNTQRASRHSKPESRDQVHLQAPIVMNADGARRTAERLLYTAWLERYSLAFSLGPKYLEVAAASPLLVPVEGVLQRVRVTGLDMALPGPIQFSAVLDGDWVLEQAAEGEDTTALPGAPEEPDPVLGYRLDFRYGYNAMYLGAV